MKTIDTEAVQIVAPPPIWARILGFRRLDKSINYNYNSGMMNYGYRKFFAFTLAEVLITLGIIGVVAALTIPTLISNYKEKQTVTRLKKIYSTLANAVKMAEYEHGNITSWFSSENLPENTKTVFNNIKPYMRISKDCGFESGCVTQGNIRTLDGREYVDYDNREDEYHAITSDGVSLMIYSTTPINCQTTGLCGNIKVDIDGMSGDYTFGKDVFIFNITNKGIEPSGIKGTTLNQSNFEMYCNIDKTTNANGQACAAWVIYNENMEYLHCNDLSWDGKHKCD